MRVLLITSHPYGPPWSEGAINMTRRLAQYLSDKDAEVVIVAAGQNGSTRQTGEFGEEVFHVQPAKDRGLRGRSGFWLSSIKQIYNITKEKTPDIALLFASASLFLAPRVFILKSLLGSRLILYVSGLRPPTFSINWFLANTETLVGSPFLLRWFPQATVVYPITPTHLRPVESSRRPAAGEPFSLLYLGTAQKERGLEYLLQGLAAAREQTSQSLKLVMALNGKGSENYPQVKQLIADLGLTDVVSIHGIVDINEAYEAADVVIIPRQQPIRMAFPLRILEALAFGKPVIVTSVCDMGSLIEGCGLVVDPKNPKELAQAIVTLAANAELYQQLARNCSTVLQQYEPSRTLASIYSIFERVINERDEQHKRSLRSTGNFL